MSNMEAIGGYVVDDDSQRRLEEEAWEEIVEQPVGWGEQTFEEASMIYHDWLVHRHKSDQQHTTAA